MPRSRMMLLPGDDESSSMTCRLAMSTFSAETGPFRIFTPARKNRPVYEWRRLQKKQERVPLQPNRFFPMICLARPAKYFDLVYVLKQSQVSPVFADRKDLRRFIRALAEGSDRRRFVLTHGHRSAFSEHQNKIPRGIQKRPRYRSPIRLLVFPMVNPLQARPQDECRDHGRC